MILEVYYCGDGVFTIAALSYLSNMILCVYYCGDGVYTITALI